MHADGSVKSITYTKKVPRISRIETMGAPNEGTDHIKRL
jgi:hypothetical protein